MSTDPSEVMYMKDIFLNRRNLVLEKLKEIKGINCNIPQGVFYLFLMLVIILGNQTEQ